MNRRNISLVVFVLLFSYGLFYLVPIYKGNSKVIYNHSQKLWAHRVLDFNEVNEKFNNFNGVEVDVFFENYKGTFDVRHHGKYKGNTLLEYFNNINHNEVFFWIDLKNLDKSNVKNVLNRLNVITENSVKKKQIIIESKNIELLDKLQDEGYFISYWLPSFNVFRSPYEVFKVKANLIKFSPNAISCSHHNVDFYSRKFPSYNLHCWANGLKNEEDRLKIIELSERDNVKVILVDFDDNFLKE
jgi:hypothetical protein